MKLSRSAPSAGRVPLNAVSRPAASRSTVKTGCTTKRISSPRSASSAKHQVDQERHVVVDDLEHRMRAPFARSPVPAWRTGPSERPAGAAPATTRHPPPARRAVADHDASGPRGPRTEQRGDEILRHRPIALAEDPRRRGDQRRFGALLVGARTDRPWLPSLLPADARAGLKTRVFPIAAMASRPKSVGGSAALREPRFHPHPNALGWNVPRPGGHPCPASSKQPKKRPEQQPALARRRRP